MASLTTGGIHEKQVLELAYRLVGPFNPWHLLGHNRKGSIAIIGRL